jgi:hypothetical protein
VFFGKENSSGECLLRQSFPRPLLRIVCFLRSAGLNRRAERGAVFIDMVLKDALPIAEMF